MRSDTFWGRLVRALAREVPPQRYPTQETDPTFFHRVIMALARDTTPAFPAGHTRPATTRTVTKRRGEFGGTKGIRRGVSAWFIAILATVGASVFITGGVIVVGSRIPVGPDVTQTPTPNATHGSWGVPVGGPRGGSGPFSWFLIGVGGLLVALGVSAIVLLLLRRRYEEPAEEDPG